MEPQTSLCFSILFNGTTSHPFFLTGPANCSIFGLHIHTLLRTPPHTHSLRQTHTLTHSLARWRWGHGEIELLARAAADIIVRAEGRRFHR